MNILFITNNYPDNDRPFFGSFVQSQLTSLLDLGHSVDINIKSNRGYLKWMLELAFQETSGYDVIHCHHLFSYLSFRLLNWKNSNVVVSLQNNMEYEVHKNGILKFLLIILFRVLVRIRKDKVIEKNNRYVRLWSNYYVLPNGVNTNIFNGRNRKELRNLKILFVSSSHVDRSYQKGEDIFDEIVRKLPADLDDCEILKIKNLPVEDMPRVYKSVTVLVSTSRFEGSSNAIKEALASGCAVLASDVGDSSYLLKDIPGCSICANISDFINRLSALHKNGVNHEEISKCFLAKRLDTVSVANKLVEIYNDK